LGRRDPYLPLILVRLRSQLVHSSEVGGWVAGHKSAGNLHHDVSDDENDKVWNAHIGVRVNCLGVVVSGQSVVQSMLSIKELLHAFFPTANGSPETPRGDRAPGRVATTTSDGNSGGLVDGIPIRWRADFVAKKASLTLLGPDGSVRDAGESGRSSLTVMWTLLLSLEESPCNAEATALDIALIDVSIVRSADEMQVLEPMGMLLRGHTNSRMRKRRALLPTLNFPGDSPWNEIADTRHQHGWDVSSAELTGDGPTSVSLLMTPTKVHVSAGLVCFLLGFAGSFSSDGNRRLTTRLEQEKTSKRPFEPRHIHSAIPDCNIKLTLQSVDIVLVRETGGKSTGSFASFVVKNLDFDFRKHGGTLCLTSSVADVLVFDRSFRPGLCTVSRKYYGREPDNTSDCSRPFLAAKVQVFEGFDSTTVKLNLHFGNIKCLVSPSLLQGLLSFQGKITSMLQSEDGTILRDGAVVSNNSQSRKDFPLGHIDFYFSFVVDGFECVFSSREIPAYIREQTNAAINVVSFRWNSSGEAVFILCALDGRAGIEMKLHSCDQENAEFRQLIDQCASQASAPFSKMFAAKTLLFVHGFQILRTQIVPLARSEKDLSPYHFKVTRPTAGEQLITNSFDFNLAYNAFGARLCYLSQDRSDEDCAKLEASLVFAHSMRLEAQLVDVLLYIGKQKRCFMSNQKSSFFLS
jgi:hypothetical protein